MKWKMKKLTSSFTVTNVGYKLANLITFTFMSLTFFSDVIEWPAVSCSIEHL